MHVSKPRELHYSISLRCCVTISLKNWSVVHFVIKHFCCKLSVIATSYWEQQIDNGFFFFPCTTVFAVGCLFLLTLQTVNKYYSFFPKGIAEKYWFTICLNHLTPLFFFYLIFHYFFLPRASSVILCNKSIKGKAWKVERDVRLI